MTLSEPRTLFVTLPTGVQLHTRQWSGTRRAFVLLHGLSSNCTTWDGVAKQLAAAGHRVVSVDQRGHGLSDKPDDGYGFATVASDLSSLLEQLSLQRPIVAGQSWGGNVTLEFGARFPTLASGFAFVDGGFLDLQGRTGNGWDPSWEGVAERLRPHEMDGMRKADLEAHIRLSHPDWPEWGIEATMRNFEWLPDGSIRRWLPVTDHMQILRALWEQRPPDLYPLVEEPVLICPADDGNQEWVESKKRQVTAAQMGLAKADVHWFPHTHHDIHIERSNELARLLLDSLEHGVWAET
jgi:pimeloyl-ACP methyl ester carboxylesterase